MGLFDGPPITDVDHDRLYRSVHLNLIGQVNMLHQHNYELQAKLELANSRIAELEAALKPFTIELLPSHNVYGCEMVFVKPEEIATARKVLENK